MSLGIDSEAVLKAKLKRYYKQCFYNFGIYVDNFKEIPVL